VVRVAGTPEDLYPRFVTDTEQPLDLAVNGRGFFQITDGGGTLVTPVTDSFHLDADGQIP